MLSHHAWPSSMQRLDGIVERCRATGCSRQRAAMQFTPKEQASTHEHQHLRPWLCRRGVARLPRARRARRRRRRRRPGQARPDPRREDAGRRGGHGRADGRGRRQRPRVGHGRRARGGARHRALAHLRRHAVRAERQPGPVGDRCVSRSDIGSALRDKVRAARHRLPLDARARDGRGRAAADSSSSESGKRTASTSTSCFQPEFLREGSSIRDYDKPPFTIVGANARASRSQRCAQLFGHLPCEFHATSIRAAEMVKYCCNNFHALKITFANETARLVRGAGRRSVRGDGPRLQGQAAQHLAGLPEARLRVRRLVPAEGLARRMSPLPTSARRAADARRHPASEPRAHRARDRKVLETGKRRIA